MNSSGSQGDERSRFPSISSDGRYVAYDSLATNLVANDANGTSDVFVSDRHTGTTERVSVDSAGTDGNGPSWNASVSGDGRYIAYQSWATNLVSGDTNGNWDIFVRDRQTGTTERVSLDSVGTQANADAERPSVSGDGRYVAFRSWATNLVTSDTNGTWDVFVRDRQTGTTERVSVDSVGTEANGLSWNPSVSGDGRYVAFYSLATNLVSSDSNGRGDIFVRDRQTGTTERVSVNSVGTQGTGGWSYGPSISGDGRHVAFNSAATNLVTGDTNGVDDSFVHDRQTGSTVRVSVDSSGMQANGGSWFSSISGDGRHVAFSAGATNLVAGDTNNSDDVFIHDRRTGSTERLSVDSAGSESDGESSDLSVSSDGRYVAFHSLATNLVVGDTNGTWDVFVRVSPSMIRDPDDLYGDRQSSGYAGDPVNTATGNFTETHTDLAFPDAVRGLAFTRTYNGLDPVAGPLGLGWTHRFATAVDEQTGGDVNFTDADGRVVTFFYNGSGYDRPEEVFGDLVKVSAGIFRIDWDSGETWEFDGDGRLDTLTNWDGHDITLTWSASGLLTDVASSAGYDLTVTNDASNRIIEVEASDGRAVTYGYTDTGALETVTDPEGGVTTYESDPGGRVTKVTDAEGRLLIANYYDSATGRVIHQRTPGGDEIVFVYDDFGGTTRVTYVAAAATVVYHHDRAGRVIRITDAAGEVLTKNYDIHGNLVEVVDRLGATADLTYDGEGRVLTVTDADTGTTTYDYDSSGRPETATDDDGEVTTFAYTGTERLPTTVTDPEGGVTTYDVTDGLVTEVTDPDGVTTTFAYSSARNLTSIADENTDVTAFTYDGAGNRLTRTTPEGNVTTWTYDDAGRVLTVTDAEGGVTGYTYDDTGRLLTTTDPTSATETRTYNDAGLLATVTSPEGNTTSYTYDPAGRLVKVTDPTGASTTSTYGPTGRVETATDPVARTTTYDYDADGNQNSVTDPTGATSTTTYNTAGQVTARADALGHDTTFTYDSLGRPETVTDPEGGVTTYAHDAMGRRTTVTDPEGGVTTTIYTAAGRTDSVTNPEGEVTDHAYDVVGRLDTITHPGGGVVDFAYDDDGRITSVTSPEGNVAATTYDGVGRVLTETNPAAGVTTRTWSDRGELLSETDPTGGTRSFAYDDDGNLVTATDANGNDSTYGYDAAGRRTSRTDATGGVERWSYDPAGQLVARTDPLGRTTSYNWDGAGRPATVADPSGRTTTHTYDAAGRLTSRVFAVAGGVATVNFGYDEADRRTSMTDGTGTTGYTHDDNGRLTGVTLPGGATLAYAYDDVGRRTSLTYPGGATATSAYDAAGRLDTLVHSAAGTTSYDWDDDGRLTTEGLPGGATRSYTYADGWLAGLAQTITGATFTTTLARDDAGRITSETTGGSTTSYGYDPAGQLTTVTPPAGPATTYSYDDVGRRVTKTDGTGTTNYGYDPAGQLTTARSGTPLSLPTVYNYDAAGRRTREIGPGGVSAYHYDEAGRLAKHTRVGTGGASTQTRAYNGDGQLASLSNLVPGSLPSTTTLTWDANQSVPRLLERAAPSGTTSLVAGPQWTSAVTGATSELIATDAYGSVVPTAGTATLAAAADYDAWGEPAMPPPASEARLGYRGELTTGDLVHLRARDYQPATASFTAVDPLDGVDGLPTLANPYHYADNDPINKVDPLGLRPLTDAELRRESAIYQYMYSPSLRLLGAFLEANKWKIAAGVGVIAAATLLFDACVVFTIGACGLVAVGANSPADEAIGVRLSSNVLQEFLRRSGFTAAKALEYANSFSGRITARIAQPGETFLRYTSRPDSAGEFLTKTSFSTPAEAVKALDLATRYGNSADYVQRVVVSRPTLVFEGGIKDGAKIVQTLVTEIEAFVFHSGVPL